MVFRSRSMRRVAIAGISALCACAGGPEPVDPLAVQTLAIEESAPLGGNALAQRIQEMERAHRDMVHFHATLRSLRYRDERESMDVLGRFLHAYMGLHVDPLLRPEWQSSHAELMGLDANLRFAKANLLLQLREQPSVLDMVEEITDRFRGREDILVDYPIGTQNRLAKALEILRGKKWWSP